MMGTPLLTEPIEIAAAYLFYLCSNHAFVDGNKRVALATCLVFLSENNLLKDEMLDTDAWENLTLGVAAGVLSRDEVTAKLKALAG
jgi:death-on-curing protein